jgi:hypothetical protein
MISTVHVTDRSPRYMIERRQQVRPERGIVLDQREVAHPLLAPYGRFAP